jgi:protein TonB
LTGLLVALLAAVTPPAVAAPPAIAPSKPAIATMPKVIAGGIVHSDYPSPALRYEMTGETRASMTVSRQGRVTRCRIARSSGHLLLDDRTCQIALTRLRLSPALDAAGTPIDAEVVMPVLWLLGDPPTPKR